MDYDDPTERFDATARTERVLPFRGPDGLRYELVATDRDTSIEPWDDSDVPAEFAVRGFHGVTLALTETAVTADLLEVMGYEETASSGAYTRFEADGGAATVVDLHAVDERGRSGIGTVHHVAFRVPDDEAQTAWREALSERGYRVTPQKDRQYFRSIYFREQGGVLFEFATDGPGFTADEDANELGDSLQLPPWLADDRERIEAALPELGAPEVAR